MPALEFGLRLGLAVWETRDEAIKIVSLGGAELAWENGSSSGQEENPGGIWAAGGSVALKWVEREVWVLFWRHWALGTDAGEGQSAHSGGLCSVQSVPKLSLSICCV